MALDAAVLRLQSWLDGVARWLRLRAPAAPGRRFLIVQIDGLARAVLERELGTGRLRGLGRLLRSRRLVLRPLSVGLPSSTPFFQAALMYGVQPDIPGFHYHDKRAGQDRYFPRPGVAALVEEQHGAGRRGIMEGGSVYGCVFTGGAAESLWTMTRLLRPTRAGMAAVRVPLSAVLLGWVVVKCCALTLVEVTRALLGLVADPLGTDGPGLRWLLIKIGLSIWTRQLLTLAASADLYRGVPAIYVNYLEYDVFAHAFGPTHPHSLRALRRVDRSIAQLDRIVRRLPEHRYDLYVLSDHGQAATRPFTQVSGGASIEAVVGAALGAARSGQVGAEAPGRTSSAADPSGEGAGTGSRLTGGGVAAGSPAQTEAAGRFRDHLATYRGARGHGLVQRFLAYLERDFPRWLRGDPEAVERDHVRVVAAGPNAFVYFTDRTEPLSAQEIEARYPGVAAALSRHPGVGLVLARSAAGPVCWYRGARTVLGPGSAGPFGARPDREVVVRGVQALMDMASAGDLVLYGIGAAAGDVSFLQERGAHAGPSEAELHTFLLHPPGVRLPEAPLTHPAQLYPHFMAYRAGDAAPAVLSEASRS